MNFFKKSMISVVFAMGLGAFSTQANAACGSITVAEMNWASAEMLAHIDKVILENGYGCEVELVPGSTMPCLLYTSPSPRDVEEARMPSSA